MVYFDLIITSIMLIICAYTDIKNNKIPHIVVIPVAILGLLNTALLFNWSAAGLQLFAGIISIFIGYILYRMKMCGGGDVFLVAAMICTIGWQYALLVVSTGMILGVFYALYMYCFKKKHEKILIPLAFMCAISYMIITVFNMYLLSL